MKAFIELKNDFPVNTDIMAAVEGFEMLGYDIKTFNKLDIVTKKFQGLYKTNPFIGSIDTMKLIFKQVNCFPDNMDSLAYPILRGHYKRNINFDVYMEEVISIFQDTKEPLFIKPLEQKLFDGILIKSLDNLHYLKQFEPSTKVIVSDPILEKIKSEYRCFVFNDTIVDARCYSGDFHYTLDEFDWLTIQDMVDRFKSKSPISYTLDIGILGKGNLILIETSDFWSVGQYGLDSTLYAKMLEGRYFQILTCDNYDNSRI